MFNPARRFLWFGWLFLLAPCFLGADEGKKESANILARFKVADNGDALLIPVTLEGKEYQFIWV